MTFPCQTRLEKMRLLVICIRGTWALLMPQWNITKLQMSRINPREQDMYRTASWYSRDLYGPILTDLGLGRQRATVSWNWWALHHCNKSSQNQAAQSHWLGWVCFCWCAWLEIAHQQRFGATRALNTQQWNPISTAESQICPPEFWGSEINKIHPGIMQCLISISNSSICNSRNLLLDKSGQYEIIFYRNKWRSKKALLKITELSTWGSSQSEIEQLSP